MRETKFRGLNVKGQWEYGYVVREQFCAYDEVLWPECNNKDFLTYKKADGDVLGADSTIISYGYKIYRDGGQSSVWAKRDTVGQDTGLQDKNGKEIYEADILNYHYKKCKHSGPVIFSVEIPHIYYSHEAGGFYEEDTEIIGNIYENPELLEVGK